MPLEKKIPEVIVLAVFIEKDSFSLICEMFDMCSFEMLVIVILIGIKLFNELRRYVFVGGLCCHLAQYI